MSCSFFHLRVGFEFMNWFHIFLFTDLSLASKCISDYVPFMSIQLHFHINENSKVAVIFLPLYHQPAG